MYAAGHETGSLPNQLLSAVFCGFCQLHPDRTWFRLQAKETYMGFWDVDCVPPAISLRLAWGPQCGEWSYGSSEMYALSDFLIMVFVMVSEAVT